MQQKYVKKTIYLNQDYLKRIVKLFNVKTEKDAVNRAMELALEEEDIVNTMKEIGGSGHIERVFS